ncbi:MAG: exodeoxyribonuclease VII small subunit [Lachnospiraceae bacterium]|nr:exodeoxyribonuclease VII small subunit [Lachnospiraceae bacterium]
MEEEKQMLENEQGSEENGGSDVSLEELFSELDEILAALDDPEISLEDSFALYEKGMKKVRQCNDRLDMVEKKMMMIAQDGSEVPFEE